MFEADREIRDIYSQPNHIWNVYISQAKIAQLSQLLGIPVIVEGRIIETIRKSRDIVADILMAKLFSALHRRSRDCLLHSRNTIWHSKHMSCDNAYLFMFASCPALWREFSISMACHSASFSFNDRATTANTDLTSHTALFDFTQVAAVNGGLSHHVDMVKKKTRQ